MAHTNSTTYYSLPQFESTDKPAWLTDFNGAMSAIDTGIHNAQDKADDAAEDATQALSDASSAQSTADGADAKGSGAVASIAENFEATSTYSVGDLVMYNSLLYKCKVAITVPGAWSGSANWDRVTVDGLNSAMDIRVDTLESATTPFNPGITVTKNSGAWNAGSISQRQQGKIVYMTINFSGSGTSVSAGSNGFTGLLSVSPVTKVSGFAFVGSGIVTMVISTDGTVTVRPLINNVNWGTSDGTGIPISFMVN